MSEAAPPAADTLHIRYIYQAWHPGVGLRIMVVSFIDVS